jgi:hypothetical protein
MRLTIPFGGKFRVGVFCEVLFDKLCGWHIAKSLHRFFHQLVNLLLGQSASVGVKPRAHVVPSWSPDCDRQLHAAPRAEQQLDKWRAVLRLVEQVVAVGADHVSSCP